MRDDTWTRFCRDLERAGAILSAPGTPQDALTRAEGVRYLTRLLRAALEKHVESSDPLRPRFHQMANEIVKWGNDNPDNVYDNCTVSVRQQYRDHHGQGHRDPPEGLAPG